jgi:N-acetylglucosaminyldiphosphoundecaprenol N-acetyl-beta-D-mannosaminyltransferase
MSDCSGIFGLSFTQMTQDQLAAKVTNDPIAEGAGPLCIYTANLDHIVNLRRNSKLRNAYRKAWVVTADGMPVFLYAKVRGVALKERLTGADLFGRVFNALDPTKHRCFFIASSNETALLLRDRLVARGFDVASIDYDVPPHGFENDPAYSDKLTWRIRALGTTHLFLGVGAPKSEIWVDEHRDAVGDCYVLNVGAGLDFLVGTRQRAPRLLQRIGFEWFWRFIHEPRRLFRRYFVDSWSFLAAIRDDILER